MDLDPVILSRIQFAFVISFHIIFPAFTIGLAAWLATIEGMRLATGNALYRRVFDFWLKVFALSFGMGVVSGIVMAFQFGTNWSVLAENTGSIQGPLLGYEAFTAFMLEATFFGVMLLGRDRGRRAGSIFSPAAWSRSARCSRRSGSSPTTAGCRSRSAIRSSTARSCPTDWWAITTGPGDAGALAAHAARRLPDHRHVRRRHRRLVPAARHASRGGARDAALGSRARRGADPGAARSSAI